MATGVAGVQGQLGRNQEATVWVGGLDEAVTEGQRQRQAEAEARQRQRGSDRGKKKGEQRREGGRGEGAM
jgi:hypothetical protein